MTLDVKQHRFTVAEYNQMGRAGILGEDDRVELIDGVIFEMTPIGRQHAAIVNRLNFLFSQKNSGGLFQIGVQNPTELDELSEPQPDVMLLRWRPDFYASRHPTAESILLLVEVVDTTEQYDRRVKLPLYARDDVQETWLVLLNHDAIAVYREPSADGYRFHRIARRGEFLSPLAFPDWRIAVDEILG